MFGSFTGWWRAATYQSMNQPFRSLVLSRELQQMYPLVPVTVVKQLLLLMLTATVNDTSICGLLARSLRFTQAPRQRASFHEIKCIE